MTDEAMVEKMRDLISHFVFMITLAGSEHGVYEDWHLEMSHLLLQCASATPPESDFVVALLERPAAAS